MLTSIRFHSWKAQLSYVCNKNILILTKSPLSNPEWDICFQNKILFEKHLNLLHWRKALHYLRDEGRRGTHLLEGRSTWARATHHRQHDDQVSYIILEWNHSHRVWWQVRNFQEWNYESRQTPFVIYLGLQSRCKWRHPTSAVISWWKISLVDPSTSWVITWPPLISPV